MIRQNNKSLELIKSRENGLERQRLKANMWVDILNDSNEWRAAKITRINECSISYIYLDQPDREEMLGKDSNKIAPFRTFTKGASDSTCLLPFPGRTLVNNAQMFSEDEFFTCFEELEDSLLLLKKKIKAIKDKRNSSKTRSAQKNNQATSKTLVDMVPLLDRTGLGLRDMASLLSHKLKNGTAGELVGENVETGVSDVIKLETNNPGTTTFFSAHIFLSERNEQRPRRRNNNR